MTDPIAPTPHDVCRSPYCECPPNQCRNGLPDMRGTSVSPLSEEVLSAEDALKELRRLRLRVATLEASLRKILSDVGSVMESSEPSLSTDRQQLKSLFEALGVQGHSGAIAEIQSLRRTANLQDFPPIDDEASERPSATGDTP